MDGWDDDVFDDEAFDDIHVEDDVDAPTAAAAAPAVEPTATAVEAASVGWGSSIQSFQQHHELNLNMSPLPTKATAAVDDMYEGWSDNGLNISNEPMEDSASNNQSTGKEGVLSRAAGAFGAALLASMDQDGSQHDDDDDDESNHDEEDEDDSQPYRGFGRGFVMKGLQGFIKAATTPQKVEGDGWDEEDDLDLEDDSEEEAEPVEDMHQEMKEPEVHEKTNEGGCDDELKDIDEPELNEEPANEDGWDEFDVNISDTPEQGENNNEVSDSLKDFVAKTESTLNSAFMDASKTPRKTSRDDCVVSSVTAETDDGNEIENDGNGAVSKSLTDFVDTLDAELKELQGGLDSDIANEETEMEATVPCEETYNFDENKDNSPEPVKSTVQLIMPHQDSWYLNAMEGGKGGLIYSDQNIPSNLETRNDPIFPADNSGVSMNDVALSEPTPVGMPLSEMPSVVNSENNSRTSSNADFSASNGCNFQQSELQCNCLELILPLPNNGSMSSPLEETESGFGTKTLSDGTIVLVNYEKLLQNEATKRILLQRSVETYERTMEKIQARHHVLMKMSQEHEEARKLLDLQLGAVKNENANLKELVEKLHAEKECMKAETPSSEAHLFQEELSAAANERERLEKQVGEMAEQLRLAHEQHETDMESRLGGMKTEQSRLEKLVQSIQSDLIESQQTCSLIKNENDALQSKIESAAAESESSSDETTELKAKITSLETELREKANDCDVLNDQISEMASHQANQVTELRKENDILSANLTEMREKLATVEHEKDTLCSMQHESRARIAELTAMMESTETLSEEVNRLTAENASLTYEMGVKSTENDDNLAALRSLQCKLDAANSRLSAIDTSSNNSSSSEIENSLRAENDVLKTNLANLQSDLTSIGRSKADLELSLEQKTKHIDSLEVQLKNIQTKVSLGAQLESEVANLRDMLDRTERELQEIFSVKEDLNAQLIAAQSNHQALVSETEEQRAQSHQDTATMQSQLDEVRKHHDDTMGYMEEQLSGLMQQNSALTSQLNECRMELERVQGENLELSAALKIAHETSSANCNLEANQSKQRVKELEEDVNVMQNNIQSLNSTIEELLQTKLSLVAENANLSLALQNATITDGQDKTNQEITELRTSVDQYQKSISDAEQVISDLKAQNQALQDSNAGHQCNFDDLSDEYEETRQAFERVQMENGNLQARNRALEQDNKSLEFQLSESTTKSNHVLAQSRALEQENKSLELQFKEASAKANKLEASISELQTQLEDQEKEALEAITQWETRCSSLEAGAGEMVSSVEYGSVLEERDQFQQQVDILRERVNVLTADLTCLQTSQESSAAEKEKLLARIMELEQELKDDNINELRDELTSLHEERHQLDLDNEELLVQLGLMQQSKLEHDEEVQDELTSLRGQVATLHDNIACLQQELEESRSSNTSNGKDISDVVDKLHRENIELQNNISRLSSEKSSLEGDITHLHNMVKDLEQQQHINQGFDDTTTQQLEAEVQELKFKLADKEQEAVAAKEKMNQAFNHHASEIEQLQTTLRELELKLADKDNEAKSAKEDMKHALERKDEDILKLTAEGFLRETTIKDMTRQIEAKSIVDSLQANFCDDRSDPVVEDDEEKDYGEDDSLQDLLADNIESDDYLRDQIVILAQALERSELQRADVLDRLTRERKSNSDSLKQLGESVKRFYSAVRCSDT